MASLARAAIGSAAVPLHYVARAGLIPELSGQTYDAFYKAVREAVLNSLDAGAREVVIDLDDAGDVVITDDGHGMDLDDLSEHFVSVGGSARFGDTSKFGRIGIGSLALLQYGRGLEVETKRAGASSTVFATIEKPAAGTRALRRGLLSELAAGSAEIRSYAGPIEDHFTRIRLCSPTGDAADTQRSVTACAALEDRLQRVLPLAWPESDLACALAAEDETTVSEIRQFCAKWSADIRLETPWGRIDLIRRHFGDRPDQGEAWTGRLVPVAKDLWIDEDDTPRRVMIRGFLATQAHASAAWSGLTARVQNVAVEERTFFDVESDPGFRKYITGEIYLMGDLDRHRLINIDRASFSRESADYRTVRHHMASTIQTFKAVAIQRPQRQKVALRRVLNARAECLSELCHLAAKASRLLDGFPLPPSGKYGHRWTERTFSEDLKSLGCTNVSEVTESSGALTVDGSGDLNCEVSSALMAPKLLVSGDSFSVVFGSAGADAPAVMVRRRPRAIWFNWDHPSHSAGYSAIPRSFAIELAYLLGDGSADDMASLLYELFAG